MENKKTTTAPPSIHIPKPILKWVGGKTQLLDTILSQFPKEINNYYEPFLGGASILFALLAYQKQGLITIRGKIHASDINEPLIHVYKNIQSLSAHTELFTALQQLIYDFNSCPASTSATIQLVEHQPTKCKRKAINPRNVEEAGQSKEHFYYWIRGQYNRLTADEKKSVNGSAMFIFLNKTCFRGVFRIGPNGFNVPYGNYENPEIINREHLEEIHKLIQGVDFRCQDFSEIDAFRMGEKEKNVDGNNFIYMDPPYYKETDTSFVGYTGEGFGIDKHTLLFNLCNRLEHEHEHERCNDNATKIKFMMSNSNTNTVKQAFLETKYTIQFISAKRSINSKNPESKTTEIIIKNY